MSPANNRTVLINVEAHQWEDIHKVWPHLGLLFVGTAALREGYEVVLWDEHIQGPAPLEELIKPGDIVGLSLVVTGIMRGVNMAKRLRALGAKYVIAGNDAAMFRAQQLMNIEPQPFDAIFTSNSLTAVRQFYRQVRTVEPRQMQIPNVCVGRRQAPFISNEAGLAKAPPGKFGADDYFIVPELNLYDHGYWSRIWSTYRAQFGGKHRTPDQVKNGLVLFGQGCAGAAGSEVCNYCSIAEVANLFLPDRRYLEDTVRAYSDFGINTVFNVTDSSFELGKLATELQTIGARFDTLVIYGRAQAMAKRKEFFEKWLNVVNERLLINCGMDAGDDDILKHGIGKAATGEATTGEGSRLAENYAALRHIKEADSRVHLHFSLIFGSPGETRQSCERSLDFLQTAISILGSQLDVGEFDYFWLNFGAPCAKIFRSYHEAQELADRAANSLSYAQWYQSFGQHADELVVPWSCQEAWYTYFTKISIDEASEFIERAKTLMKAVPLSIQGRDFAYQPPPPTTVPLLG